MANKKFRVLVACMIGGIAFRADDVVALPDAVAKAHAGQLDGNKDAVSYALSVNGNEVKAFQDPGELDALRGEVAALEARLAAAAEAEKPALAEQLDSKKQELAELTE